VGLVYLPFTGKVSRTLTVFSDWATLGHVLPTRRHGAAYWTLMFALNAIGSNFRMARHLKIIFRSTFFKRGIVMSY